jgi:hypothetical protein
VGPGFPEALTKDAPMYGLLYFLIILYKIIVTCKDASSVHRPHFASVCPYIPDKCETCQKAFKGIQAVISFALDVVMPYFALSQITSIRSFDVGDDVSVLTVIFRPGDANTGYEGFFVQLFWVMGLLLLLEFLSIFVADIDMKWCGSSLPWSAYVWGCILKITKMICWPCTIALAVTRIMFVMKEEMTAFRTENAQDELRNFWDLLPIPACFNLNLKFGIGVSANIVMFLLALNTIVTTLAALVKMYKKLLTMESCCCGFCPNPFYVGERKSKDTAEPDNAA